MRKKIIVFGAILVVMCLCSTAAFVRWLFSQQYNANGISHFLVITRDEKQSQTYVGRLDDYDVYLEGLSLDDTYFISIKAQQVPVQEALEKNLVSLADWSKFAREINMDDNNEILK